MKNKYELWNKYCGSILDDIKKDPKSWTAVSADRCIFETILLESGNYNNMDWVIFYLFIHRRSIRRKFAIDR